MKTNSICRAYTNNSDAIILGGVPCREASPVIHLIFERGEERLGNGVVVAAAGAAAGQAHVVGARPFGQKPASVLGARSAWNIALPATQPRDLTDASADTAMSAVMRSESDQPTLREFRSIMYSLR